MRVARSMRVGTYPAAGTLAVEHNVYTALRGVDTRAAPAGLYTRIIDCCLLQNAAPFNYFNISVHAVEAS